MIVSHLKDLRKCIKSKCPVYQPPGSTRRMSLEECKKECSSEPDCVQDELLWEKEEMCIVEGKSNGNGCEKNK